MTRIPGTTWRPGPADKVGYTGYTRNAMAGMVFHSAEGYGENIYTQLMKPRNEAIGSWCLTNMKDGALWQHYELEEVLYHAGNLWANVRLVGVENEGVQGERLTEAQINNLVKIARFIGDMPVAYALLREPYDRRTLWEHNEVVLLGTPNAGPTQCPSGRIPWDIILERLMPTPDNDPNREGDLDTGLVRIHAEVINEANAQIHKQAEGDAKYLIAGINRVYGTSYHL